MDRYLWVHIFTATLCFSFRDGSCRAICRQKERRALLSFKDDLADPSNSLRSWSAEAAECCRWAGVVCDNSTRRVVELRLHGRENHTISTRSTTLNPSLLHLRSLSRLDLGGNNFSKIQIPKFLGSMTGLTFLDLSDSGFRGLIPQEIGNLSGLQHLNLSRSYNLEVKSLGWLSTLPSLECLDLSSVELENAAKWEELVCMLHNLTELHLSDCFLPHISPALPSSVKLSSSLRILDLSNNDFGGPAPNWVFELTGLVHLDICGNYFYGSIPPGIQNMTALRYLDLSQNNLNLSISNWMCNFKGLEYLDLSYNELSGTLCDTMENLSSLHVLRLSNNHVHSKVHLSFQHLCTLTELDLSYSGIKEEISLVINDLLVGCFSNELTSLDLSSNQLYGPLHDALDKLSGQMKNLESLILRNNSISGPLPASLGEFHWLRVFDVSMNKFNGSLPKSIGGLNNLRKLDVSSNNLSGTLLQSIGGLTNLQELGFENNSLSGVVSEVHLKNLTSLKTLTADGNQLEMRVPSQWVPPFQLRTVFLESWQLGPGFPLWICSQHSLEYLVMSNAQISGPLPPCLWNLPYLQQLSLKNNTINGSLPNWIPNLPYFTYLDLSGNLLSGHLFPLLCHGMGNPMALSYLNLTDNHLTGNIPECWARWTELQYIYLENNRLTGSIPASLGLLSQLTSLRLSNNRLSGEIPKSLQNCTDMLILDLRMNEFGGMIPRWLGGMPSLRLLNLRKNKFHGNIPHELCQLKSLQILDLAQNNLSESIPKCFDNFSAMANASDRTDAINEPGPVDSVFCAPNRPCRLIKISGDAEWSLVVAKGMELFYRDRHKPKSLDLSENNLCGQIPRELTGLVGLISLNLSKNHLSGSIPSDIGEMRWMESLDLSWNQLSGEIPPTITALTFLSYLNVSHNKLIGKIPTGTQIQSMNESGFLGNHLYGPPLTDTDTNRANNTVLISGKAGREKSEDIIQSPGFYVSMAVGFWVGYWGVIAALLLNKSWRYACIRFTEGLVRR